MFSQLFLWLCPIDQSARLCLSIFCEVRLCVLDQFFLTYRTRPWICVRLRYPILFPQYFFNHGQWFPRLMFQIDQRIATLCLFVEVSERNVLLFWLNTNMFLLSILSRIQHLMRCFLVRCWVSTSCSATCGILIRRGRGAEWSILSCFIMKSAPHFYFQLHAANHPMSFTNHIVTIYSIFVLQRFLCSRMWIATLWASHLMILREIRFTQASRIWRSIQVPGFLVTGKCRP